MCTWGSQICLFLFVFNYPFFLILLTGEVQTPRSNDDATILKKLQIRNFYCFKYNLFNLLLGPTVQFITVSLGVVLKYVLKDVNYVQVIRTF